MDNGDFAKIMLVVLMVPATILLNAWVLTMLWGWFVVPFGLPQVGMAHAYGLVTLAGFFKFDAKRALLEVQEDVSGVAILVVSLFAPMVALLFGWIAQGLM